MNWNDLGRQIDALIGMAENSVHQRFQTRINAIISMYDSLVSNYADEDSLVALNKYNRLNKAIKQLEQDITADYSALYKTIAYAQVLAFIHSTVGSAFLLSGLTGLAPVLAFPKLLELRKFLKQDTEEYDLLNTLSHHRNDMLRELKGTLNSSVNDNINPAATKKRLKRIAEKYTTRVQRVSTYEIGRAESLAEVEIGQRYDDVIELIKEQTDKAPKGFKFDDEERGKRFVDEGSRLKRIWVSQRDLRVRTTHIVLDGQAADHEGLFYSKATASYGKGPRLMIGINAMQENIGCRCSVGYRVNGIELDQLDEETMSADHREVYEKTSFDHYQDWLQFHEDDIAPDYYNQLSKQMMWYKNPTPTTEERTEHSLMTDAKRFRKMVERGFHKKKDGSWGY
ncbi:hypothetical protein [Jeotgalicoccus sp. FSL K6-3177]|uniref:hypothetical protein n=1 Tax=Jeotgalicoccus sp. FSL K6-3177 TaxID=2921494 RepID=UPI0030FDEEAA